MATLIAEKKMAKARTGLVLDAPFFGSIALRMQVKEDPSCETMWVDGKHLGYNPEFVDGLTLGQTKGVLAHEVMHIAASHHLREGTRNHARWNMAGDYAINDNLTEAGFELPPGALQGQGLDKSAEAIYPTIPEPEPGDGGGGGGSGNDPGGCGEVRPYPGKDGKSATAAEIQAAEADVKVMVSQAATAAKACGKLPGGLERFVGDLLEAHVPWKEVLWRFVTQAAKNDYTWTRPNRRYVASGLYLPSLYNEELGDIVCTVDTSGSISDTELSQYAAELSAIVEFTRAHLHVFYVDTQVQEVEEFGPEDLPLVLKAKGGGGTDFRPAFAEVDKLGIEPVCMVYLTDGECWSFPDPAPSYPVLWGLQGGYRDFDPPFGEVVKLDLED